MPLDVRSISTNAAVASFFLIAIIGWTSKLSSVTCCKRAVIAAIVAYAVTAIAVKAINAILINAMVNKQLTLEQEKKRARKN